MHYDGGLKLLIDRRVKTRDEGGIGESMYLSQDYDLTLDFQVKLHELDDLRVADAQRTREILVV